MFNYMYSSNFNNRLPVIVNNKLDWKLENNLAL